MTFVTSLRLRATYCRLRRPFPEDNSPMRPGKRLHRLDHDGGWLLETSAHFLIIPSTLYCATEEGYSNAPAIILAEWLPQAATLPLGDVPACAAGNNAGAIVRLPMRALEAAGLLPRRADDGLTMAEEAIQNRRARRRKSGTSVVHPRQIDVARRGASWAAMVSIPSPFQFDEQLVRRAATTQHSGGPRPDVMLLPPTHHDRQPSRPALPPTR